jgi:CubicO group peptidase (beta-lactamase class C family)
MERVTGESWKQTLDRLVFTPLGMRSTSANVSKFPTGRLAMPYGNTPTGFERIPYGKTDANMQSAGGLVTSLEDIGRWLEANLNEGRIDGKQVIPAAAMTKAHTVRASQQQNRGTMQFYGYALGWNVARFGGDTIYTHGGGFAGFATQISFMPHRRVGIATFANSSMGGAFADLAAQMIYDIIAGAPPITADSLAALRALVERQRANIKADRERRAARSQVTPLPYSAYAGTYESPAMGTLVLSVNAAGKLEARSGVAWSNVEVFDGAKHELRVELFGGGSVLSMEVQGDRVVAGTLAGVRYAKVR